jgi:hypothetical protein
VKKHDSRPIASTAKYFALMEKHELQRCRGCQGEIPKGPHEFCYCCTLGISDPTMKGKMLKEALKLAEIEGPAGQRGARMHRVRPPEKV